MKTCDNNCEALADLYQSSVNLISYSKLINQWLNGAANATVNIGGENVPTLRNLVMAIKELVGVWPDGRTIKIDPATKKIYVPLKNNGGIVVDANGLYIPLKANGGIGIDSAGNLYADTSGGIKVGFGLKKKADGTIEVDFSQNKDTSQFRALLATFNLPIFIKNNVNIFVNAADPAANDNDAEQACLDAEDSNGSPNIPFASIQGAVNFVSSRYNLNSRNCYIYVKSGTTYNSRLTLPDFNRTSGVIRIVSWTGSGTIEDTINQFKVDVSLVLTTSVATSSAVNCSGGSYMIRGMKAICSPSVTTSSKKNWYAFSATGSSTVTLVNCNLTADLYSSSTVGSTTCTMMSLYVGNGASVGINPGNYSMVLAGRDSKSEEDQKKYTLRYYPFYVMGGSLTFGGDLSSGTEAGRTGLINSKNIEVTCYVANKGAVNVSTQGDPFLLKMGSNYSVNGTRFSCQSGGSINAVGQGYIYFPGVNKGTGTTVENYGIVDSDTFAWYKP